MMFKQNKYTMWYNELISSRLNRVVLEHAYYENHHILPKSLGGSNNSDNMILLTAKEHFIAHLLLSEMCINDNHRRKMQFALQKMMGNHSNRNIWSSAQYELARLKNLKALRGRKFTNEHKKRLSESNKGVKRSKETKERLSVAASKRIGKLNPFYKKTHSQSSREKISKAKSGKKKWITNGVESKLVDINSQLDKGWVPGRVKPY
jgi:hypothetical protein